MRQTSSALAFLFAAVLLVAAAAHADLVSEDGDFGPDTVTRDTETGLRWLDLTESTNLSLSQAITETEPGGQYEGWRIATTDEVATFFGHAGLDLTVGSNFVPQSYGPAMALAELVGITGMNGNCGTGCTFSYAQGYRLRAPGEDPANYYVSGVAWFDNSPPLNPIYPQAPIGRVTLASYTNQDAARPERGVWLVAPEPGASLVAAGALGALASLARRARARCGSPRP